MKDLHWNQLRHVPSIIVITAAAVTTTTTTTTTTKLNGHVVVRIIC